MYMEVAQLSYLYVLMDSFSIVSAKSDYDSHFNVLIFVSLSILCSISYSYFVLEPSQTFLYQTIFVLLSRVR